VIGANAVFGSNGDRKEERVAVRLRIGDRCGPGCPTGTAAIVDDDALPERLAQRLTDNARHGIGRASGREIDDQRDRTVGIILRSRFKRRCYHRCRRAEQRHELAPSHAGHARSLPPGLPQGQPATGVMVGPWDGPELF